MKTTLTTNHDSLRIAIAETKTRTLNLTISRSGERVSGRGIDVAILKQAMAKFRQQVEASKTYGEMMAKIAEIAKSSPTITDFINAI